jgi:hypothetical protein
VRSAKIDHSFNGYANPRSHDDITLREGEDRDVVVTEPAPGASTARSRGDPTRSETAWLEKNRGVRCFFVLGKRGGAPGWLHSLFRHFRRTILSA